MTLEVYFMKGRDEFIVKAVDLFTKEKGIDLVKYVSISELSEHENRGLPYAILLVKALPKEYIQTLAQEKITDGSIFQRANILQTKWLICWRNILEKRGIGQFLNQKRICLHEEISSPI